MCDELQAAVESAKKNTYKIALTIDALPIPSDYKGVFMRLADERGFRFDDETLRQMETVGRTGSEICLMILQGNSKQAGLIAAYRLATGLDDDKQRAKAVEIAKGDGSKTINEKGVLLAILSVRDRERLSA